MPKLTIGVPVLNGERTLARALDGLLAQRWRDLEVRVSDNGSTDTTATICRDYAERDSRVRIWRRPETVSAMDNFRGLLDDVTSPYFMFAAADDWWAPEHVERNLENLDRNADAVLSCSRVEFAGANDRWISRATFPLTDEPVVNLRRYLSNPGDNSRFYGIHRTLTIQSAFHRASPIIAWDWLVVALTLLDGKHLEVPEVLMGRGETPGAAYQNSVQREGNAIDHAIPGRRMAAALLRAVPPHMRSALWPAALAMCLRSTRNSPYGPIRAIADSLVTAKRASRSLRARGRM